METDVFRGITIEGLLSCAERPEGGSIMSARESNHSAGEHAVVNRSTLSPGKTVIYPGQGPCRIDRVVKTPVNGTVVSFYHLIVLDESGGELFIPVSKARAIGIRSLITKSEIPALLGHLRKSVKASDNWRQRATDNARLLNSGAPLDLVRIVASLTELSETRSLTLGEVQTLGKARKLLVCEISAVIGEAKIAVEQKLDQSLNSRNRGSRKQQ